MCFRKQPLTVVYSKLLFIKPLHQIMKKVLTLLAAALCITVANAQNVHQKDQYQKTFIQNTQRLPNQQLQASLRDGAAWENFRAEHGNWWVEFKEETGTPHRAFGAPIATTGVTASERAFNFIANELTEFKVNPADLRLISNHNSAKYYYVTYIQQYNGLDVMWSEATVRLNMNNQVMMFGMDIYNNIDISTIPAISADGIKTFAAADIALTVLSVDVNNVPKILPIPGASGIEYKLIYEVTVNTTNGNGIPGKYYSLVDANNGTVYYRSNQVHECGAYMMAADLQADAAITDNPLVAEVNRGLPYLRVEIDGDYYYTDQFGHLSLNFISVPTPATVDLRGLYARVSEGTGATNIESVDITIFPGDNVIAFDEEWGSTPSEVSAYYWQNIVHDHMKSYFPDFTGLDVDQLIRVERNDGTCNAFYDGTSTNFYQDGGGCPATGLFNDVVMHEYGHGVNYDLYAGLGDPGGMNNGAMQEGYADLWGMTVTNEPWIAKGFFTDEDSYIRQYNVGPKIYPQDLIGEVHADGEIIAGAWWDVNINLGGDLTSMTNLWMDTHFGTIDGPSGDEGSIYTDVLIEALVADDDNGDLTDGTPNFEAITTAFCLHGISLIGQVSIDHEGVFTYIEPESIVEIEIEVDIDYPTYVEGLQLFYRLNNELTWQSVALTEITESIYKAEIPEQELGTIVSYYTEFSDVNGCGNIVSPFEASDDDPNLPYFAFIGYYLQESQDFDNTFGSWEVDPFNDDDATTGMWDVNTPIASIDDFGYIVQTGEDHTLGESNLCAFTGNAGEADPPGTNDVDGGKTTLRSPFFDMTLYENPMVVYWRKFSNDSPSSANPGNDVWQVYITDNAGDTWVPIERTYTADNSWRRNAIRIEDYVSLTSEVGFIFIAQDSVIISDPSGFNGGSLVEAAIDDLEIWDTKENNISIESEAINQLLIYPNPSNGIVNFNYLNFSSPLIVDVTDQLGRLIYSGLVEGQNSNIDLHKFGTGVYYLKFSSEKSTFKSKVIIF